MVQKIYKFTKPGQRNFTIKKFGPGLLWAQAVPRKARSPTPSHLTPKKSRKSVCGFANFCFARDAKFPAVFSICSGRKCTRFPIHFSIGLSEKFQLRSLFPLIPPLLICTCPAARTRAGSQGARIPQNHEKSGFWIFKRTAKGRQKDGKRTARHGKNGAFQVKEHAPFQVKEMKTISVEVLSLPSRRRRPGSVARARIRR